MSVIKLIIYLLLSVNLILVDSYYHLSIGNVFLNNVRPLYAGLSDSNDISSSSPKIRSREWAAKRGIEPGFGGIWEGDPNAPKFNVTFVLKGRNGGSDDKISLMVPNDRYLYHYFEEQNMELPVINKVKMCRQGCCTVCAAKVIDGKVKMDVS